MGLLNFKRRYCDDKVSVRSLWEPSTARGVVVCLPGGPGLGSSYLESFMVGLAERTSLNVAILDLPNHGESAFPPDSPALAYSDCLALVRRAVSELAAEEAPLYLLGQSFGARIALDLLPDSPGVKGAVVMGLPYIFCLSRAMFSKLGKLKLEALSPSSEGDAAFARNWSQIFPLYTTRPLSPEVSNALSKGTRWNGNHQLLDEVPPIEETTAKLSGGRATPLLVVEGEKDEVVPDENLRMIQELLPEAAYRVIPSVGHFPMVEDTDAVMKTISPFLSGGGRP